jgi:hypothetical protein
MIADHLVDRKDMNERTSIATARPKPNSKSVYVRPSGGNIYEVQSSTDLQDGEGAENTMPQTDPRSHLVGKE